MSRLKGRYAVLAGLISLLFVLGACFSDNSGQGSGADDHTFVYAAIAAPSTLEIWTTYEGPTSQMNGYEWGSTLVEYDDAPDSCETLVSSTHLRGNLAKSWQYSPDKKQLLIKLRSEAKSPVGNSLTAEDVVWSLDRARKQSEIVRFLLHDVAEFDKKMPFEVEDEHTVAVNVVTPTALDMTIFTWPQLSILDSAEIKKHVTAADPWANDWLKNHLATFGPWKLESFTPGSEVSYTANPNFWNKDRGNIERLVYRAVPDASVRLQLLESGEVDYAERLTFDQYQYVDESEAAQLFNCASPARETLMLNQNFAPFAELSVRRAISQSIDRKALAESVYEGMVDPAATGISSVYWEPDTDNKRFTYDPKSAKKLFAAAGVDELSFQVMASPTKPGAHAESLAIQIQSMLEQVGVTAEIDMVAGATEFSDNYFDGKYDAMIYEELPALGDPFYSANLNNTTESFQNTFDYHNESYDALAKRIRVTEPGAAREELVSEISDITVDTIPSVYLAERRHLQALSNSIEGYQNNPGGSLLIYRWNKNAQ